MRPCGASRRGALLGCPLLAVERGAVDLLPGHVVTNDGLNPARAELAKLCGESGYADGAGARQRRGWRP